MLGLRLDCSALVIQYASRAEVVLSIRHLCRRDCMLGGTAAARMSLVKVVIAACSNKEARPR